MLQKLNREDFDAVYAILEESFPNDERRPFAEQEALLEIPEYQIYVSKEEGKVKGFLAVWNFEAMCYIEHFAVAAAYRNEGLGVKMLKELQAQTKERICLEVELPDTDMAKRRIRFYERNQFFYNAYPYMQPAIAEGRKPIPLSIMTSNGKITKEEFDAIKALLYQRVYRCKDC